MITVVCWDPYREVDIITSLEDFFKKISDKGVEIIKTDMDTYSFEYRGLYFTIFP